MALKLRGALCYIEQRHFASGIFHAELAVRKVDLTLACLRSLKAQRAPGVILDLFVLDDASSDGTSEQIAEQFPEATLLHGNGQLYWNGGMRRTSRMKPRPSGGSGSMSIDRCMVRRRRSARSRFNCARWNNWESRRPWAR